MGKRVQSSYEKLKVIPIKAGARPGFEPTAKEKNKKLHKPKKSFLHINPTAIACKEKRLEVLEKKNRELKKLKKKEKKARVEEHK